MSTLSREECEEILANYERTDVRPNGHLLVVALRSSLAREKTVRNAALDEAADALRLHGFGSAAYLGEQIRKLKTPEQA